MITKEKILVFKKYQGSLDSWARFRTLEEKNLMSDDDWYLINSLIQDVVISRHNLNQKLKRKTDSEEVRNEIISMAINDLPKME